jgi:Tol biopolymer transport system component
MVELPANNTASVATGALKPPAGVATGDRIRAAVAYDAFISYSHAKDKPIADALQSVVQKLGKAWYRRRALRVFRDDTSLSASPHLWPSIEQALGQSRFLILLASPEAAGSRWVGQEIAYWLDHNSADTVLIALTDGELDWDEGTGDFRWSESTPLPPALKRRFADEPRWIDLRSYRDDSVPKGTEFLGLGADFAAAIRGIPKEDLLSEEVRQQRRFRRLAWTVGTILAALLVLAGWEWRAAETQRAVAEAQTKEAQLQEARAISTLARQATDRGDAMTGMLATLAVLPDDPARPDRPVSNAAGAALLDAWLRNREKLDLLGHHGPVTSVAFSPDGKRVVTGSSDNTARVWDLSGATPTATLLDDHRGPVTSVAFSPDGKRVVTGSDDNTARAWDLSGATPAATVLEGHRGWVTSVAFSPDGNRVVTGSRDNTAQVWDLSGATPTATLLDGHRGPVSSVAFSPDGKRVVTGSDDNTARVWDLSRATPAATLLDGHRRRVMSVAFSPDGKRVVTGSPDSTARVWDLSRATPVATVLDHHDAVWSVAFSPDGKRVVTGSFDNTARVWDLSGATPAATLLDGHRGQVSSVAFSPDGNRVVTGSYDNTARVWDLSGATPTATVLEGHRGWVQ